MLTEIYLVRHAHSNYSRDEHGRGVSDKGKKDVEQVTKLLCNEKIEAFVSSPYKRAIETIEGAANALTLDIELQESFKERILSHTPVEDFDTAIRQLWENPDFCLPGGESNKQAQQRGIKGLVSMIEKHEGKRIAIGTHGNIMTILMNYYDKGCNYEFWRSLSMPDIYRLSFVDSQLTDVTRIWND